MHTPRESHKELQNAQKTEKIAAPVFVKVGPVETFLVEPIPGCHLPYDLVPNPFYLFQTPLSDVVPKVIQKALKPPRPKRPVYNEDWAETKLWKQTELALNKKKAAYKFNPQNKPIISQTQCLYLLALLRKGGGREDLADIYSVGKETVECLVEFMLPPSKYDPLVLFKHWAQP